MRLRVGKRSWPREKRDSGGAAADVASDTGTERARAEMVARQLERRGIRDRRVLDAMAATPREVFVPGVPASLAYDDRALPIDAGQTISQPYMVARMTELLQVEPGDRILEIGTGSGYKENLALPAPTETTELFKYSVGSPGQLKAPIIDLARLILDFSDNPYFKEAAVLETQQADKARRDLENIIALSASIRHLSRKLGQGGVAP